MAPSAESSEMWILGKVTQLLDQGMANLGCGGRHRAPQKGAVNKGNFYKWKETNYEDLGSFSSECLGRFLTTQCLIPKLSQQL